MKLLLTTLLALVLSTNGQQAFKALTAQSEISILGTSTLHDWESKVNDFSVTGSMSDDQITDLKVEVVTQSIESGKSIMNDKTYDALKADDFAKIKFTAETLTITGSKISGQGELSLAGVTKPITIEATSKPKSDSETWVNGEVELDMTDFDIEPPTAMFGTVVTGEKVTIKYQLLLNK